MQIERFDQVIHDCYGTRRDSLGGKVLMDAEQQSSHQSHACRKLSAKDATGHGHISGGESAHCFRSTNLALPSPCSMQGMLNCRPLCKAKSTFVTMECKRPPMESSNKTIMPLPNSSPLVCFATAPNKHGHPSSPSGSSGLSAAHFFCARYHLDLLRRLLAHPSRQQG